MIIYNGARIALKFCYTCYIYRPPRVSHCDTCGNCVERFDHHCPWTGSCIGRRNYRYYYIFINMLALCLSYTVVLSFLHIVFLALDYNDAGVFFLFSLFLRRINSIGQCRNCIKACVGEITGFSNLGDLCGWSKDIIAYLMFSGK